MAKQVRPMPTAPNSQEPESFNTRADAFVGAFDGFVSDVNALATEVETNSANLETSKNAAAQSEAKAKISETNAKGSEEVAMQAAQSASQSATRAGQSETNAKNSENFVTQAQTQLEPALEALKEMQKIVKDGFIDDTQTHANLTYSSNKIQAELDKKADEATAYKDWNYKTISNTHTAQDNDALFVEATAPFEITLPAKGKVRIIDKAGNFATHNIKLVAGSDKFVLNKDFQRVELFFFNGKWQVVSGTILQQKSGFSVGKIAKIKSQLLGSKAVDRCFVKDNLMIAYYKSSAIGYSGYAVAAIDLNTMTDVMPALPSVPSGMYLYAVEASNELFLFGWKQDTKEARLFKFNRSTKNWQQISSSSIQSLINSSAFNSYTHVNLIYDVDRNKNLYIRFYKNVSSTYYSRIMRISPTGTATDCGEVSTSIYSQYFKIIDDILFVSFSNSGTYQIIDCKNLRNTPASINELQNKTIENNAFYTDFKLGKFFALQRQAYYPNKVIEWEFGGIPQEVTKTSDTLPQSRNIYHDILYFTKQNAIVDAKATDGKYFTYDTYENNRLIRKRESGITPRLTRTTPHYIKGNKEYFIDIDQIEVYEVTFTPTTFQEEI